MHIFFISNKIYENRKKKQIAWQKEKYKKYISNKKSTFESIDIMAFDNVNFSNENTFFSVMMFPEVLGNWTNTKSFVRRTTLQ